MEAVHEPLHVIPPPATPETFFVCRFGDWPPCKLSYRACLLRQGTKHRRSWKTPARTRAAYPACQTCQVGDLVAARFGTPRERVLATSATGKLQVYRPTPAMELAMKATKPCGVKGCPGKIGPQNKSGVCNDCCRRKFKVGDVWRPSSRTPAVRPGPIACKIDALDPTALSDEQLAACVREARDRKARIEREATERVQHLEAAFAGSLLPADVKLETGT